MLALAALALSVPLYFEANQGQAPAEVRYLATTSQYSLYLSDTAITTNFPDGRFLRMSFPRSSPAGLDGLPGKTHYYAGSDPSMWRTVLHYARVRYEAVFPGVDLVVYGKQQQLEYDWVVAPGADPASIRFAFSGASTMRVDERGDLVLDTAGGEVRHRKPHIYQMQDGQRREIDGGFVLARNGEVRFRVAAYDRRETLIIDPELVFSTGFGGSPIMLDFPGTHDVISDTGTNIALDRSGNIYVVGTAFSTDFPLLHSAQPVPPSDCCLLRYLFAAKLSPDGKTLLYSTYIAAPLNPESFVPPPVPAAIAVDADGNAYITGATSGINFPQLGGNNATKGGDDAFLVTLDRNGLLQSSVLIGGSRDDSGTSIALGPDGGLYIAGNTRSDDFPITAGAYRTTRLSAQDAFLIKFNPASLTANNPVTVAPVYATYLGPADSPVVTVDASGAAYVAGSTNSIARSATPGVFQPQCVGSPCADAVVLKVNPSGGALVYATYFGGSGAETVGGIAVDTSGNAYISGSTTSTDLPVTTGVFQTRWISNSLSLLRQTAFVAKLSPDATKLIYATYLGGTIGESAHAIAVDTAGNAYVAGETSSADFPITNAIQVGLYNSVCSTYTASGFLPSTQYFCASAGFLSVLDPSGRSLVWSTFLGHESVNAVVLDAGGDIYAAGKDIDLTGAFVSGSPGNTVGIVKIAPQGAPLQFSSNGITSAASFNPGVPRPGGLASIFVHGLNVSGIVRASTIPLPNELAGVSIFVDGKPAPILAVADIPVENPLGMQQINFQVPFESICFRATRLVEVRYKGVSTFAVPQVVAPGIFILADGTPAIQHGADYSLVTPAHPVVKGEVIIIYATGLGPVTPAVPDGMPATGPTPVQAQCEILFSNVGDTLYAGLTPGFVGLYQLNVRVGPNVPSGTVDLSIKMQAGWLGGQGPENYSVSNTVKLPVQ